MSRENIIELTEMIKEKAYNLGFDLVGITHSGPFIKAREVLQSRNLSSFINPDIDLLTDPVLHLPSARSIISVALSYASIQKDDGCMSYIAYYARGKDYHRVMENKMNQLMDYIREIKPGTEMKAFADTGPLLDREVALRAGLGWIGKNNILISPDYGSMLVLGEILTSLDLEYDEQISDRCGSCQECIKNCPGGALKEPYTLEYDRCVSYLTQKKGVLKKEERRLIGTNLWGCDSCQLACPYNRDVPVDLHPEFYPAIKGDVTKVFNFNENSLEKEWKDSALYWRGLRTLRRNSLINMAHLGDNEYITLIKKGLEDPSPVIRAYAVWAFGKTEVEGVVPYLEKLVEKERSPEVIKEIKHVLDLRNRLKQERGIKND